MTENKKDEYYTMQVACANCGKGNAYETEEYEIFIPKGIEVDTFLEKTPCENCGCFTLAKIMNFVFPRLKDKEDKKKKKDKDENSKETTNELNTDIPRINIFQKKPKIRVKKIIK